MSCWLCDNKDVIILQNSCLSSLQLLVLFLLMVKDILDTTLCDSLSTTCGRSVVFSGYSDFLHQWNWLLQYSWNIVESGIKHYSANPNRYIYEGKKSQSMKSLKIRKGYIEFTNQIRTNNKMVKRKKWKNPKLISVTDDPKSVLFFMVKTDCLLIHILSLNMTYHRIY
jgi:hypothetical protein